MSIFLNSKIYYSHSFWSGAPSSLYILCSIYRDIKVASSTINIMCIHLCHLSTSLDKYILLLYPSMIFSSYVDLHIQPCRKGWDLHHSRWSSIFSCSFMCYPMGSFWTHTNPSSICTHVVLCRESLVLEIVLYSFLLNWMCVWSMEKTSCHNWLTLSKWNQKPLFVSLDDAICCMLVHFMVIVLFWSSLFYNYSFESGSFKFFFMWFFW